MGAVLSDPQEGGIPVRLISSQSFDDFPQTEGFRGEISVIKTNSGKTTTLNALINEINENQNKKILTLESPVEYKHTSKKSVIVQKEIGAGRDCLCYSDGVKNCLREDCDILVIGEIRDRETMEAAIETAEAGHLVIGTLHTKSCAETIDRMEIDAKVST